jgi:hypothetical protein
VSSTCILNALCTYPKFRLCAQHYVLCTVQIPSANSSSYAYNRHLHTVATCKQSPLAHSRYTVIVLMSARYSLARWGMTTVFKKHEISVSCDDITKTMRIYFSSALKMTW